MPTGKELKIMNKLYTVVSSSKDVTIVRTIKDNKLMMMDKFSGNFYPMVNIKKGVTLT